MSWIAPTKKILNYAFWIGTLGLLVVLGIRQLPRIHAQSNAGTPIPYTVTLEKTLMRVGGNTTGGMTVTWAVRSDGSRALRLVSHLNGSLVQRVLNFASGKQIYIYDSNGTKSTIQDPKFSGTRLLRSPEQNCLLPGENNETVAGEETLEGYRTVRLAAGLGGEMILWFALDYGCAPIRERAGWSTGEVNDSHLVRLTPGEPDSEIFADPQDYQELPPSRVNPGPPGRPQRPFAAREDAYYYAHRPR